MRAYRAVLYSLLMVLTGLLSGQAMAAVTPTLVSKQKLEVGAVEWVAGHRDAGFEMANLANWAWQPLEKPSLERQPEGVWLRFTLDGRSVGVAADRWYLSLGWPLLDEVRVRLFYPGRNQWSQPMRAGDSVPMHERPQADHNLVFPLELRAEENAVVYLHVQSVETIAITLPLTIADEAGFISNKITHVAMISLFVGGMLVILLYNSSLSLFTRDASYMLYVLYLFSGLFYVLNITGFGQLFLWPNLPDFTKQFYDLSATLTFLTALLFAIRFLDVRRYGGLAWQVTRLLACYWTIVLLTVLFAPAMLPHLWIETMATLHCLLIMAVAITLWRRGNPSARLFSIAWAALLFATVVHLQALEGICR